MELIEVFKMGGVVMVIFIPISITALSLVFVKVWQFYKCGIYNNRTVDKLVERIIQNDSSVKEELSTYRHPTIQVLRACLHCIENGMNAEQIRAEVSRIGTGLIRDLESYLRGLAAIAHLSPLLGLLGTVLGMIEAFIKLQGAGSKVDPSVLAGGIWSALLTTAAGLSIAIPAMACLYYLEGVVDEVSANMKDSSARVLTYMDKTNSESTPNKNLR